MSDDWASDGFGARSITARIAALEELTARMLAATSISTPQVLQYSDVQFSDGVVDEEDQAFADEANYHVRRLQERAREIRRPRSVD